ncbi:MAG: hypothetical protein M9905_20020, partial [Rhizobiaceae bacterium]|nr:hypothetical protein [Rhizobiaceae bacterium]
GREPAGGRLTSRQAIKKAGRLARPSDFFSSCLVKPFFRYGRTPMIRAPIKANAAQIIKALIGLVSPMA